MRLFKALKPMKPWLIKNKSDRELQEAKQCLRSQTLMFFLKTARLQQEIDWKMSYSNPIRDSKAALHLIQLLKCQTPATKNSKKNGHSSFAPLVFSYKNPTNQNFCQKRSKITRFPIVSEFQGAGCPAQLLPTQLWPPGKSWPEYVLAQMAPNQIKTTIF